MANCPKCGTKLKLTDISPNCPKCGVNMRLFGFADNFYKETKTAELSQAGWSCRIRRMKTAMVGTSLTKARLAVMLLPTLAMLLPAGSAELSLPFKTTQLTVGLPGFVSAFTGGEFELIRSFASGTAEPAVFRSLLYTIYLLAATALFAVLVFFFCCVSFLSIKKMQKVNGVLSALGMAAAAGAQGCLYDFLHKAQESVMLTGNSGFGLYIVILAFAVVFTINLLIDKKGLPVEYPEGMVERSEIWKKVKAGEVNIDELPYPVVETEETRKLRALIDEQRSAFAASRKQETEVMSHE